MNLMPPLYVTAVHYKQSHRYEIRSTHFTLGSAKRHFSFLYPDGWKEVMDGCWEYRTDSYTATIQRLPWVW